MERDRIDEKTSNILTLLEKIGFVHKKEYEIVFRGFTMKMDYLNKKHFCLTHIKNIDIEITKSIIMVDTTSEKLGYSSKTLDINDYVLIFKHLKTLLPKQFRKIVIEKLLAE
jgi:hypothetical protein